jgi:hypothetical protein
MFINIKVISLRSAIYFYKLQVYFMIVKRSVS